MSTIRPSAESLVDLIESLSGTSRGRVMRALSRAAFTADHKADAAESLMWRGMDAEAEVLLETLQD